MARQTSSGIALSIMGMVTLFTAFSLPALANEAPSFTSGSGIKVIKSAWLEGSSRTIIIDIETPLISKRAVNGGINQVFITLPDNYFSDSGNGKRFPVLYLLHGGAGGSASQWTTGGGTAETSTSGKDLITVMPDCGKVGWFTDWVDESAGAQHWETFHLTQLIPWIDANLRTNPDKTGRAVAGLSMGGYGAFHYAFRRPDLFAYAASFSGALNLQDAATQLTIAEQSIVSGFSRNGAFGPISSDTWKTHNPLKNVESLRPVQLAMYAGAGINDGDILERTMGNSTYRLYKALNAANIPVFFWMYGRPGGDTGCDGGHNFGCWNLALNDALPKMLRVITGGQNADAAIAADKPSDMQYQPLDPAVKNAGGQDLPADVSWN